MDTYDPHKNTTQVRQGDRRKLNLRVLVLSTIGVVVLFAVIFGIATVMQPATEPEPVIDVVPAPAVQTP